MHTTVDTTEKLRILIANDTIATREFLWDILEFKGHKVAFATSGEVALERLRPGKFSVLFLDPALRDMPGWEVMRLAREQDPALCIILLATRQNEVTPVEAARARADGCIARLSEEADREGLSIEDPVENLDLVLWQSLERRRLTVANKMLQKELDTQRIQAAQVRQQLEEIQQRAVQTERAMALLNMANAASCELIQPLKVLIGRIDLLMQESVLDGQLIEEMIGLRRQAVRMSPIVHRMGQISSGRAIPRFNHVGLPGFMPCELNWG